MKVDKSRAAKILEEEAQNVARGVPGAPQWVELTERLSHACDAANRTQVAALGTAILSKATNLRIDPTALKASTGPRGYSARAVAKDVLAAHAVRLGIDLGVTGREPLNNQPFFAETRISMSLPVKGNAREALKILVDTLKKLDEIRSEKEARSALRAFLQVRKKKRVSVSLGEAAGDDISPAHLKEGIADFVQADSEEGRRAQAVVSGLMDVGFGRDRVMVSRINDPDRRFPCDVGICADSAAGRVERTFEVRDKPIPETDLYHVAQKCLKARVTRVGVAAVSASQAPFDTRPAETWSWQQGLVLTVFFDWSELVDLALLLSPVSTANAAGAAYRAIFERLREIEVSPAGLIAWKALSKK